MSTPARVATPLRGSISHASQRSVLRRRATARVAARPGVLAWLASLLLAAGSAVAAPASDRLDRADLERERTAILAMLSSSGTTLDERTAAALIRTASSAETLPQLERLRAVLPAAVASGSASMIDVAAGPWMRPLSGPTGGGSRTQGAGLGFGRAPTRGTWMPSPDTTRH